MRKVLALLIMLAAFGLPSMITPRQVAAAGDPFPNGTVLTKGQLVVTEKVTRNGQGEIIVSDIEAGAINGDNFVVSHDRNGWGFYSSVQEAQLAGCLLGRSRRSSFPQAVVNFNGGTAPGDCSAYTPSPTPSNNPVTCPNYQAFSPSGLGEAVPNCVTIPAGVNALTEDVTRDSNQVITGFVIWGGMLQGSGYNVSPDHNGWATYQDIAAAQAAACQQATARKAAYPTGVSVMLFGQVFNGSCPSPSANPSPSGNPSPNPSPDGARGKWGCPSFSNQVTSPITGYGCLIPQGGAGDNPSGWFRGDNVLYVRTDVSPFTDVAVNSNASFQIFQLAARGIIRGYGDGTFGPNDQVLRAQMAAMIARAMGWDAEDHGNTFTDQGSVDNDLWRNVGTLQFYGVAKGYGDGTFHPMDPVLRVQAISFITRAMVAKGYWVQQPTNPTLYGGVLNGTGNEQDVATYVKYAGDVNTGSMTKIEAAFFGWNEPAPREFFATKLWAGIDPFIHTPTP